MTPEEVEKAIARLFEGQDLLTGKVAELTENVAELTENVTVLTEDVGHMRRSIEVLHDEAEVDRKLQRDAVQEMRAAVNTMLGLAESLTTNVTSLARAQKGTSQRVSKLEKRVSAKEEGRSE
jgi:uncharacterized protein YoxC